jgi:hypothetical protein
MSFLNVSILLSELLLLLAVCAEAKERRKKSHQTPLFDERLFEMEE